MTRLFLLILMACTSCCTAAHTLQVTKGELFDYYHLAMDFPKGQYRVNAQYDFNEGGQFEVLLKQQAFPYPAPNCVGDLIVRMPYSAMIENKRHLYLQLLSGETVPVVLELNPYIKVTNDKPLELELTNCHLFFRHKYDDYFGRLF